jgi:hypothetical protein
MRRLHPLRLQYEMLGPSNPFSRWIADAAAKVRADRHPVAGDNPFLDMQEQASRHIVEGLETWRKSMEKSAEQTFMAVFGVPWLQAMLGMDPASKRPPRKSVKDALHGQLIAARRAELRSRIGQGGLRDALARALVYCGMAGGAVDERGFETVQRLRRLQPADERPPIADFKALIREQYFMLLIDEEAALAALPAMLPGSGDERREAFEMLRKALGAAGSLSEEREKRLNRIAALFRIGEPRPVRRQPQAMARSV